MIIGFFSDHNFLTDESEEIYTSGTLDSLFWKRYLDNGAHHVIAVGRYGGAVRGRPKSASAANVSIRFSESLSSPLGLIGFLNDDVIKETVREVDKVIVRLPSEIGNRAIHHAKRLGIPVACEVVACPKDALQFHGSLSAKLYSHFAACRMKRYVGQCDAALYVTQVELQRRYPNIRFVASASNVELHEIKKDCMAERLSRFRKRVSKGELTFGLVGTLQNKSKGVDIAIKALAGKNHKLVVIGRGSHNEYTELAENLGVNVDFKGFINQKEVVFSELDDVDIYLQPSFQEGLSRSTLEAMSRGCPVLTSSAGGFAEITHPEFLHNPGDHKTLSADIDKALTEQTLQKLIFHSLKTSEKYLRANLNAKRIFFYKTFFSEEFPRSL